MPIQPFTPAGVNAKRLELYSLPDRDLFDEADAIEADLRTWMPANFSLSPAQSAYLTAMDNDALKYYGQQCALCFRNRLDITLVYPIPIPGYIKWVVSQNDIIINSTDSGVLEVTGSLTFTMEYRA